jgi:hypothetical protein
MMFWQEVQILFFGSADGSGLLRNADGTLLLVNHEDNFAVSRVTFDKHSNLQRREYLLNSNGGTWRLCGATMATVAEHGFGPLYLTCGESGEESRTHGIIQMLHLLRFLKITCFRKSSAENAMPLKHLHFGKNKCYDWR